MIIVIMHSIGLLPTLVSACTGLGQGTGYDGVTLLAYIRLDRMYILAFSPILLAIVSIWGWRFWKHINNSQQ